MKDNKEYMNATKKLDVFTVKFSELKEKIDNIVEKYLAAKEKNDESLMKRLSDEYNFARIELNSNQHYFSHLKKSDVEAAIEKENDIVKKRYLMADLQQKKRYKDNKHYIDMVMKSNTIDKYIKNKSHKKRNFVRKHFKKFVLGVALVASLFGLNSCSNKKGKALGKIEDTATQIESMLDNDNVKPTQEPIAPIIYESTPEAKSTTIAKTSGTAKTAINYSMVDSIVGAAKTGIEIKNNDIDETNDQKDVDDLIPNNKTTVTEKPLDPGIINGAASSITTVIDQNITGPSVEEEPAVDFIPSGDNTPDDNTNDNNQDQNSGENNPSDDNKNDGNQNDGENDLSDNKENEEGKKDAADAAGNHVEENPEEEYPIPEDDKMDPNYPPAGELPKDEIENEKETEIIPDKTPAEEAGNKIDDEQKPENKPSDDSANTNDNKPDNGNQNNGENNSSDNKGNYDDNKSPADAAGDNIDETNYGEEDMKLYDENGEVIFYANSSVLDIDGEAYTLKLV